jgi:hypothetical protein
MSDEQQKMHCASCGADWFSAAAADLVASGTRCLRCDGKLVLGGEDDDPDGREGDGEPRTAGNGPAHPPDA